MKMKKDYRNIIAERIKNNENVALYCYGVYCSHMLCYLDKFFGLKPAVIIDNDVRKRGVAEFGIPIMPFAEAVQTYDNLCYFICSNDYKYAIIGDLLEKGVGCERIINYCSVQKTNSCLYFINQINLSYDYGKISFSHCNIDNCHDNYDRIIHLEKNDNFGQVLNNYKGEFFSGNVLECENCKLKFPQYVRTDGKFDIAQTTQNSWDDCLFNCTFCQNETRKHDRTIGNTSKEYGIFDKLDYENYLSRFFKLNCLDDNPILRIVLSERFFNDRVGIVSKMAESHDVNTLVYDIFSGFSTYSENLANILENGKCIIIWSLDAGNRKTFEKIKRVDAFDEVVDNAKKYISKSVFGAKFIVPKYLFVKGVNDSEEEFNSFFELISGLGMEFFAFDWDFAIKPNERDIKFIRECYSKITVAGMKQTYNNINKVISEALNKNFLLEQGVD